jgi:hypothetical protein
MTRNLFAAWILSLAFTGIGNAQGTVSPVENGVHYTQAQLKDLMRNAHAPDQYRALATYYGERHERYLKEATEENKEWERRSQNIMSVAAKYPRPVDSARNLYEYYMVKASESGALEEKYSQLAAQDTLGRKQ